jgi:hypothetical protein
MFSDFDLIAKKLWFRDGEAIRLVRSLRSVDRAKVQERLLASYGVTIDLSASESEIHADLERAYAGDQDAR